MEDAGNLDLRNACRESSADFLPLATREAPICGVVHTNGILPIRCAKCLTPRWFKAPGIMALIN